MSVHLAQLEMHVTAAAIRCAQPRRRQWPRLPRRPLAVAMLVSLAGGAAGAVALSGESADPAIVAKLAVLRRDRVASDDGGALIRQVETLQRDERSASQLVEDPPPMRRLNFTDTRRVRSPIPQVNMWFATSTDDRAACLVVQLDGRPSPMQQPCIDADQLDVGAPPITATFQGHTDVFGIVPDGIDTVTVVLANGSERPVEVIDNVYAARFATPTRAVTYTAPSGPVRFQATGGG